MKYKLCKRGMSQNDAILKHLKEGKTLNQLQAIDLFGCTRLPSRIWELRNDGHQIWTHMLEKNDKQYAQYYMEVN